MNPLAIIFRILTKFKLTPKKLAKEIGVHPDTMDETLYGDKNVTPFMAERLEKKYGINGGNLVRNQLAYKAKNKL